MRTFSFGKRPSRFIGLVLLNLFGFSCACNTGYAQTTADITGRVVDPSGSPISGATVIALNVDKKTERRTDSNGDGYFTVASIDTGNYQVTVRYQGFEPLTKTGIHLDVNESLRLDFSLLVGQVNQNVNVAAAAPQIETNTAQLGTVMTEKNIADLPLNSRNFSQLLQLMPGASPISVAQNAGGGQTTQRIGVLVFPAVNGQTNRSNDFRLDGVYNNGAFTGTYAIAPNLDALSEFKVQSHSDLAEFGGVTGGVINVATKSGSNEFHGSLYDYFRNNALDARGFFTAANPELRQNQFGGTAGGPVIKNKTFFFFSYEGFRQVEGSSQLAVVPTQAELNGDFSAISKALYDPHTTAAAPGTSSGYTRVPYVNNRIPSSELSPSIQAFATAIIPKPVNTGFAAYNAINTDSETFPANNYSARVDQYLSSRDWIWFRYNWGEGDQTQTLQLPGTIDATRIPAKNLGANYTHTFGPNTVANFLFGFSSTSYYDAPTFAKSNLIAQGYFSGFPNDPRALEPGVSIPGYFSLSMRNRKLGPQRGWQYRADLSHNAGSHSFKFGAEYVRQPWTNIQITEALSFSSAQTANLNSLGSTGNALASFVLGVPEQAQLSNADAVLQSQNVALYAQDSWKVTNRLTVNYGLRWELAYGPTYLHNFPSDWDFNTGKFLVGATEPPACSQAATGTACLQDPSNPYLSRYIVFTGSSQLRSNEFVLPGPRLGLAYRLDDRTVLRGSYGIFYDLMAGVNQQAQNGNLNNAAWPASQGETVNVNTTYVNGTADAVFGSTNPYSPAPTPARAVANYYDPRFRNPYSQQWNFEIQRELARNLVLSTAYVGSHSLRLSVSGDYNTALYPGPGAVSARALWPQAPVTSYDRSIGQSKYNALQAKLERRFESGLSFLLSYTWSKSIDTGSSGQFEENVSIQNAYDVNASRSVSGFDIPQQFSVAAVYALPFGHGKKWLNNGFGSRILGNWQLNAIVQARSGQPYSLETNLDIANVGALDASSRDRPNLVGNPNLANPTPSEWFNTLAFAAPAPYTYGTAGRNILRSDPDQDLDLSLFREDKLSERFTLQFRAESFNLLNHPTFDIPQTTFGTATFGTVSDTISTARQIQLSLKLLF